MPGRCPKTSSVAGSNACQIGLAVNARARMLVVTSAIDNLCKGAAGQAIQCANVVSGSTSEAALPLTALPVCSGSPDPLRAGCATLGSARTRRVLYWELSP